MTNQKEQMDFDLRKVKGNYWAFGINDQPEWIRRIYKYRTIKTFFLDGKPYDFSCFDSPELVKSDHGTFTIFLRGAKSEYDEHVQLIELTPDEASSLKRAFALFKEWVLQKSLEQAKEKEKEIDYTPVVENINQRLEDIKNSIGQEMLRLKTPGLTANEILNTKAQLLSFIVDWFPFGADTCPHCYKAIRTSNQSLLAS